MYYPSSFSNVRPYDPRHNTMGGPVDVPLMATGREREIPLDLSIKTVRPNPESSAELMMEHRKLFGYFSNNFCRPLAPNNVQASYIDRSLFRVPYRADPSMAMMTSPYCVDSRQAVSTVAPTLVSHHPMMSSLLQQQPSRDNRLTDQHHHQRVPKPHSNQTMGYVNPMTTTGAYLPNGNVEMNKRVTYSQHSVTNNMPSYSLFPDVAMDAPKDKVQLPASRVADKPYVNGTNGYDATHYTDHLQRFCDQQFQQVMRPTEAPQQPVNPTAGHYSYCVQNTPPCVVAGKNNRTINPNHLMNYRLPVMDTRTSEPCLPPTTSCCPPVTTANDSQNLTPVSMWTGLPMANKVVAPASSPVLKRKEGSSQKESPRTARDFPGLPVTDKNRSNSSSGPEIKARYAASDEKECSTDVIVIEEDNSNNSVFSVAWKQVMAELDDRQKYTLPMEQPEECWRTFKRPTETEQTAPPCLEAVRPNENRIQTDLYSGVPSPLGPPQLIAAVSSAPELPSVQPLIPAKAQTEESTPRLPFHSESVFNNNSNNNNDNNNNFDTSIPLPPTFSDLEDLAAMFRLRSPFPPSTNDDSVKLSDDSLHKEEYQKVVTEQDLGVPKKTTTPSLSCGVSTPASSDLQCDTTDKFDTLSDCSRDSSKPGRKRSMLECLADSEGYVAEKKRSKTTDLFADPSQLGREERALQRAMLRFEKLEKQQQGQQHSPSRPKFNRSAKSKEVMALEADEIAFPRDMGSRRTYKSAFVDFKPEVLSSRTRNQSAAQKYAMHSRKYNKNAAYEEELRREAKRLAAFRAKRKIRKRLLARLFKERTESQNEHQSEEEEEEEDAEKGRSSLHKLERPVLSQLNVQWRPYRCRRRHFRSGLDMITRQNRKKKPKQLGDHKNRLEFFRNRRKQLILLGDGNTKGSAESGGAPPDLKRLMVNKALGETVLHRAARMGYYEVVVYCLETNYCDVNSRDNAGYTPLHECCSRGHVNISLALLQYGADVSASAAGGIRPIHDAVENDHIEVVRLLLSYGADPTIATYSGMTPAKLTRSVAMTEFFRGYTADAGVDVDKHPVLPWLFFGSSSCFDPKDSGYNVLEGIPSDNEGDVEEDDFLFEVSDTPHLPTYRVHLPGTGGKTPCNCLLLSDILKQTGLTSEEFKTTHGHIEITTISRSEFEASSTSSLLLTGSTLTIRRDSDPTVSVVKLDDSIRAILGIETITLR